jgi:hypothetical protein
MTQIQTEHPAGIPHIEFTDNGRKISFRKDCLGEVRIYRKLQGGEERLLAKNVRTPYMDFEELPANCTAIYRIELEQDHRIFKYHLEVRTTEKGKPGSA